MYWACARSVREALHTGNADVIVVDPAHVWRDEEVLLEFASRAASIGALRTRVVLYVNPSPASLHGLHALMLRRIECSLVVEGLDEALFAHEVAVPAVAGPAVWNRLRQRYDGLDRLPVAIQLAWRWAAFGGAPINVKVIACQARVSRRTLERWHERVALPTPGEVLQKVALSRECHRHSGEEGEWRARAVERERNV